jgi:O-antigen/teichoic acid export membrane protein
MIYVIFIFFLWYSNILNFSYSWIIWLYIATIISIFIFYKKYYKKYFKNEKIIFEKNLIKEVTKYAGLVFLWASASTILSQVDMQMIIYILWTKDAWYYTNYLSIINIPFLIIWPIFAFLFPVFSELYSKQDYKKIRLAKEIFTKNFILVWIMFNFFFFLFAEIITYTLFWENFIESWIILKYSILFLIFNFLLQIDFSLMAWIWRVKERVKIISIAIILNFIMNLIFIKLIWVSWAAIATWIWWLFIWIMSEVSLWKEFISKFDFYSLFKNIFILWILWIFSYKYLIWHYDKFSRYESFFILWFCFLVWTIIFTWINWKEAKWFLWEVKKLKK